MHSHRMLFAIEPNVANRNGRTLAAFKRYLAQRIELMESRLEKAQDVPIQQLLRVDIYPYQHSHR